MGSPLALAWGWAWRPRPAQRAGLGVEAPGLGGGGVAVRGWVGGVWAQAACLPRLQNQETPPWGSLPEGLRVPSLPYQPLPLVPWPRFCSPASPHLPQALRVPLGRSGGSVGGSCPSPLLPLSAHIEFAISVSATLWPWGRGGAGRTAPLSHWCVSVSSFLSMCDPCPCFCLLHRSL